MIKEDHLLACTTKMFEILVAPSPSSAGQARRLNVKDDLDRPNRSSTPELPDTHPRGHPTIHLSKSKLRAASANGRGDFRYRGRVPPILGEADNSVSRAGVNGPQRNSPYRFAMSQQSDRAPKGVAVKAPRRVSAGAGEPTRSIMPTEGRIVKLRLRCEQPGSAQTSGHSPKSDRATLIRKSESQVIDSSNACCPEVWAHPRPKTPVDILRDLGFVV